MTHLTFKEPTENNSDQLILTCWCLRFAVTGYCRDIPLANLDLVVDYTLSKGRLVALAADANTAIRQIVGMIPLQRIVVYVTRLSCTTVSTHKITVYLLRCRDALPKFAEFFSRVGCLWVSGKHGRINISSHSGFPCSLQATLAAAMFQIFQHTMNVAPPSGLSASGTKTCTAPVTESIELVNFRWSSVMIERWRYFSF